MTRACVALCALLCAGACAQQPIRVTITTDPVPAEVNLLVNPGFEGETGDDGLPAGWHMNTAAPQNFAFERAGDARTGEWCYRVATDSPAMSGYLQQNVAVEAGRQYRAWTWLRLAGGRYMMLLRGTVQPPGQAPHRFDERTDIISTRNHWLAPLYLNPEHLQGPSPDEWLLMPLDITAPAGLGAVQMWLGSYFRACEMHFDDAYFGPATCTLSLRVEADAPLRAVTVQDVTSGRPILQADDLGGETTWEHSAEAMPIADGYWVTVTTDEGEQRTFVLANQ